jgi:hypothetical protein
MVIKYAELMNTRAEAAQLRTQQKPPLPLIQVRENRLELRRQHGLPIVHCAHTTKPRPIREDYGLIICEP